MLREYVEVKFVSSSVTINDPIGGPYPGHSEDEMNELFKRRNHCTLSLSPNIITRDENTKWIVSVAFNDATYRPIDNGPDFYREVAAIIKENGVCNTSGYFYAFYKDKRLMINTKRIQPPHLKISFG